MKLAIRSLNKNRAESGIIIANKLTMNSENQFSIKLEDLKRIPDKGDIYLISFRGVDGIDKKFYRFRTNNIPDENDLLNLSIEDNHELKHKLNNVKIGTKVRIKGPFDASFKEVG
jgi:hypothetical protein